MDPGASRSPSGDSCNPENGGSASPFDGFVEALTAAITSTAAASSTVAIAARRLPSPSKTEVNSALIEEKISTRLDNLAKIIGEVADRVLKYVSDRMPGLEAFTLSTLETIFAPRLLLRCD